MSSIVSDFILNPVLRQARRISEISRSSTSTVHVPGNSSELHRKNSDDDDNSLVLDPTIKDPDSALTCGSDTDTADSDTASTAAIPVEMPDNHPTDESQPAMDQADSAQAPVLSNALPIRGHNANRGPGLLSQSLAPDSASTDNGSALSRSPGSKELPEDDGMREMRMRIREIQGMNTSLSEKGKLLHETLMKNHLNMKATNPTSAPVNDTPGTPVHQIQKKLAVASHLSGSPLASSLAGFGFWNQQDTDEVFTLTQEDIEPTFYLDPEEDEIHRGCKHYRRNVKLQCSTCNKWYTCRLCHDSKEDHELIRTETKNMLCMSCACPQRASDTCVNCGESAARYYCNICKLWEDRPNRAIYHCNDCGICRKGNGLGKDFFHCKKCNACISTSTQYSHKCIERATDCNCPICEDYLFTSRKTVVFMDCGHSIHKSCHERYLASGSFKCPLCNKAITNTETLFRSIDLAIQQQPMPEEYNNTKALVLCHECTTRTTVPYHWLGLKCGVCQSYNTALIETIGDPHQQTQQPAFPTASHPALVARNAETGLPWRAPSPQPNDDTQPDIPPRPTYQTNLTRQPQVLAPLGQTLYDHFAGLQATARRRASRGSPAMPGTASVQATSEPNDPGLATSSGTSPLNESGVSSVLSSRPPIQELDADSVERFLEQFDQEEDQDILHFWDNDESEAPATPGVAALTRNALTSLQQALHSNILDNNDPGSVASVTRNALNAFQQALQARLEGNAGQATEDEEGVEEGLAQNALATLHQALHGNVVDSDDDEEEEEEGEEAEESGRAAGAPGDEPVAYKEGEDGEEVDDDNDDDNSSVANSLFAYEDPEDDIVLLGHR